METVICKEVYGVKEIAGGRYALVHNIAPAKWNDKILLGDTCYGLNYKKLDFALKKADSFFKGMRKDFVNFLGKQVHFEFENLGLVKLGDYKGA